MHASLVASVDLHGATRFERDVGGNGVYDLPSVVQLPLQLVLAKILVFAAMGVLKGDELPVGIDLSDGDVALRCPLECSLCGYLKSVATFTIFIGIIAKNRKSHHCWVSIFKPWVWLLESIQFP